MTDSDRAEMPSLEPTTDTGTIPAVNVDTHGVRVRPSQKLPAPVPAVEVITMVRALIEKRADAPSKQARRADRIDRGLWLTSIIAMVAVVATLVILAIAEVI